MIAYLDTNVFDFIAKSGDARVTKAIFKRRGISLLASEFHLLEGGSIPEPWIRYAYLKALTVLVSRYSALPLAWRHAQELRFEISRCRRTWIKRNPFTGSAQKFLRQHRTKWQLAQKGELAHNGLSKYRSDSEIGIQTARKFQKQVRSEQVTVRKPRTITNRWLERGKEIDFALDDPESYWRAEAAMTWHQAIVQRHPASRDYADYLDPYLNEEAFCDESYALFWRNDAEPQRLPLNRITGLTSFFQLKTKIGHGNAYDALHANFASECDVFLTCDRAFFTVLSDLRQYLGHQFAKPVFIDRNVSAVNVEFEEKLDSAVGNGS